MAIFRTLWPLLLAAALLLSANGMQTTILSLRGIAEGFPPFVIGLMLSAYYLGFILGCRFAPGFIAGVGHIRAFTAFASIASAAALAHAIILSPFAWLALRILTGFCVAALQMIMESWLNEQATNATRGRIMSVYRITDFTMVTVAQASIALFDPAGFTVFAVLSIVLSLALVPVALTRIRVPPVPTVTRLDLVRLWKLSPISAAATFGVGLAASSFWAMGPSFVTGIGYAPATAGYFVAAIIFGGAIAQWPVGWLSDRFDRRRVLLAFCAAAAILASLLPSFAHRSELWLIIGALMFGVSALPNFGLAAAHANDRAAEGEAVSVNGGLLMIYGVAAVLGPIIAPQIIGRLGDDSLFYWVTAIYSALIIFCLYRMLQRASPETRAPSQPGMPPPVSMELDPRVPQSAAPASVKSSASGPAGN